MSMNTIRISVAMATTIPRDATTIMASLEQEVLAAKAFLLKSNKPSAQNLYDHLCECLSKILDERPNDIIGTFEQLSLKVKAEKFLQASDTLQDVVEPSPKVDLSEKRRPLFEVSASEKEEEIDEEVGVPYPNLLESMNYFTQGGIGLGLEEVFQVSLALKKLTQKHPLASVRFWGKIFGTGANYIVSECEYQEGEGEEEEDEPEDQDEEKEQPQEDGDEEEEEKDDPPKSAWKPPPVIPKEAAKTGANKKTYFVCNEAGEEWVKLPPVTPAQIVAARQICKLFTGKLDAPVSSYPPFPGNEANYLRAQIARISSTTQISPSGYYAFDEEDEPEDEDAVRDSYIINPDYEGKTISELADESLANWVHHTLYLLPQVSDYTNWNLHNLTPIEHEIIPQTTMIGRCTWFNPVQKAEDEFEDEEEDEEEKEQLEEPEPETGPSLLTSIEQDTQVDGLPPWSVRLSSQTTPHYAIAFVSSNLWPGAHAFGTRKQFENVYIGWGLKYHANPFNPPLPAAMQEEFPTGVDINETTDPTVEQEQALKRAQEEAEANMEEEEEPDDDDDDD